MFGGKKEPQSAEQHIEELLGKYLCGGGSHSATMKLEIPPIQQLVGALTACRVPFEHIDGQIIFTTDQGTCHLDILANEDAGTTDIWFEESVTDEDN